MNVTSGAPRANSDQILRKIEILAAAWLTEARTLENRFAGFQAKLLKQCAQEVQALLRGQP